MKNTLSPKERMAIERVRMPEQDPQQRNTNFDEVNLGLTEEQAIREAQRCLLCKNRPCVAGCPVRVRIPEFIAALAEGNLPEAARILLADNTLPAVCGRVCPQETQCEAVCVRGAKGAPVAVGYLERYVADWAMAHPDQLPHEPLPAPTGKKVAIVGSGPAGLTMAGELARMGTR
jgi:NADPH-dependent glutamate synthase beta chain and related oxidoreductases